MESANNDKRQTRQSTARSRELGEELRRVRQQAGLSSSAVTEALGWSLGKLSKLEIGTRGTSPWEIGTLLGHCGADKPTRDRILTIATEPDTGSFLRLHHDSPDSLLALSVHDQVAQTITSYEPLTIPNLAQTEDYAHALTRDSAVAAARMTRREALRRRNGPRITIYVHEVALRTIVGDHKVMRDQVQMLMLMCDWERTTLRLVPMATPGHNALRHSATLLTFSAPTKPLAYTETETATVFHDAPQAVAAYQAKMRHLKEAALNTERTREVIARWADTYDRQAHR